MANLEAKLTPRERQVVGLLTDPTVGSQAEAGRRLGLTRSGTNHHATKPYVKQAIQDRLSEHSDRSGDVLGKLRRSLEGLTARIETLATDPTIQPVEAAALLKTSMDALERWGDVAQAAGLRPRVELSAVRVQQRRRTLRSILAGGWYAQGRRILGHAPLQVVVEPETPIPPTDGQPAK